VAPDGFGATGVRCERVIAAGAGITEVSDAKMKASRMQNSPVMIAAQPQAENGPAFHASTSGSE
jgi:hypothetical protein